MKPPLRMVLGIGCWLLSGSLGAGAQQAAEPYSEMASPPPQLSDNKSVEKPYPVSSQKQGSQELDFNKEMAEAYSALKAEHGAQVQSLMMMERFEYHANDADSNLTLNGQGWVGGDIQKLWLKAEGEYATRAGHPDETEIQALYSRAVRPFWDLQAGMRQDIGAGPSRSYAAIGIQGLAPYWFELDAALFLSDQGKLSARLEAEYEFRLGQRLLLQPRVELDAAFADDQGAAVESGLDTAEVGLRLRYEITREFAPYVGIAWERSWGDAAEDQNTNRTAFVAGVRFWF